MPDISVIMPVYNVEDYLAQAIKSILNQTYTNFEFIIINDCSTDSTPALLKRFKHVDKRVIVLNNYKRLGVARSLNKGLKKAKGKYIARMDGDDISKEKRFETQKSFLDHHREISLVGTWAIMIDVRGNFMRPITPFCEHDDLYNVIIAYVPFSHGSVMMRKEVFDQKKIKGYNPFFESAEDYDLWLRMIEIYKVANIPEYLYIYRVHNQSVGATKGSLQKEKSEFARINAINRRGLDYKKAMQFSDNWQHRCFYYNYEELITGRDVVLYGNGDLVRRSIDLIERFGCKIKGLIEDDQNKLDEELKKFNIYQKKELMDMEDVMIVMASRYWKDAKEQLINKYNIDPERIVYSFYI